MIATTFPTGRTPEILLMQIPNCAAAHNGLYRGEDITDMGIETICNNIADGSFKDLFIGDYFKVHITTSYTPAGEDVLLTLAGFDMYLHNGDTELIKHHAVVVPRNCFTATAAMNTDGGTTGGYVSSNMHATVLPVYATALEKALSSHIIQYKDLFTTTVVADGASMAGANWKGYSSNWAWSNVKLRLMSEVQVYGSTVFSSSFYDVGAANLQLPIFRLNPGFKVAGKGSQDNARTWYWLSAVASASSFAYVGDGGRSTHSAASSLGGVRPLVLIGNP